LEEAINSIQSGVLRLIGLIVDMSARADFD